jgi:hypothetical protein
MDVLPVPLVRLAVSGAVLAIKGRVLRGEPQVFLGLTRTLGRVSRDPAVPGASGHAVFPGAHPPGSQGTAGPGLHGAAEPASSSGASVSGAIA